MGVEATRYIYYSDYIDSNDAWTRDNFTAKLQARGNLGSRMGSAFREVLQDHDHAIIIGSDCIQLTPNIIMQAYRSLQTHDVAIGPSADGGYYLLGLNQANDKIFNDIEWSTQEVYPDTIRRVQELNLTHDALPMLSDIDYVEDWEKYKHLLK